MKAKQVYQIDPLLRSLLVMERNYQREQSKPVAVSSQKTVDTKQ